MRGQYHEHQCICLGQVPYENPEVEFQQKRNEGAILLMMTGEKGAQNASKNHLVRDRHMHGFRAAAQGSFGGAVVQCR